MSQSAVSEVKFFPDNNLEAVFQPIGEASGMPNAAYTRESHFLFERDHLFSRTWVAIDFPGSIQPNMVRPVDFMGYPLVISSTKQGDIRVFHNVCSHRGMKLVDSERTTKGIITCPYHSWSYDHKGNLKATPHIGGVGIHSVEGFNCDRHKLREVRSHIWMGVLFVNLDGNI